MRTPNGQACPYYYINAHRRAAVQEVCHLLDGKDDAATWTSELCFTCPVPEIKRVNQCTHMALHARIGRRPWRFWEPPRMLIWATCDKSSGPVKNPKVGCGHCHTPLTFVVGESDHD
jgi:hypothetical protein